MEQILDDRLPPQVPDSFRGDAGLSVLVLYIPDSVILIDCELLRCDLEPVGKKKMGMIVKILVSAEIESHQPFPPSSCLPDIVFVDYIIS